MIEEETKIEEVAVAGEEQKVEEVSEEESTEQHSNVCTSCEG